MLAISRYRLPVNLAWIYYLIIFEFLNQNCVCSKPCQSLFISATPPGELLSYGASFANWISDTRLFCVLVWTYIQLIQDPSSTATYCPPHEDVTTTVPLPPTNMTNMTNMTGFKDIFFSTTEPDASTTPTVMATNTTPPPTTTTVDHMVCARMYTSQVSWLTTLLAISLLLPIFFSYIGRLRLLATFTPRVNRNKLVAGAEVTRVNAATCCSRVTRSSLLSGWPGLLYVEVTDVMLTLRSFLGKRMTHSHTHSHTHSLTRTHTHSLTHSLTLSPAVSAISQTH